jgi:hypothetical protein
MERTSIVKERVEGFELTDWTGEVDVSLMQVQGPILMVYWGEGGAPG